MRLLRRPLPEETALGEILLRRPPPGIRSLALPAVGPPAPGPRIALRYRRVRPQAVQSTVSTYSDGSTLDTFNWPRAATLNPGAKLTNGLRT